MSISRFDRIRSVDVARGLVMAIMAVDHVRVYMSNAPFDPMDIARTTPAYYLTRWITHLCAPAFVFLAGTSAYLHAQRLPNRSALSRYLLTRGLWLVLLELTLIRLFWTFNVDYAHYILGGVIWMLGWCLVTLAGAVWVPRWLLLALGLAIVGGHNGWLAPMTPSMSKSSVAPLWQIVYSGGGVALWWEGGVLRVLFSVLPWAGVMWLGYAFAPVMTWPAARRDRWCLALGAAAIVLFVGLRLFNVYGNPRHWAPQATTVQSLYSFFNTAKYPASLQFLLMTLGPTLVLLPLFERTRDRLTDALAVFGRVPFFYYLLHILFAHLAVCVMSLVQYGTLVPYVFANFPLAPGRSPDGWGIGLAGVWLVTITIVVLLYFPCRWFAEVKRTRAAAWMSYL